MELRVLQYFLAIANEQSISGAAETLHLSQPTLSRQIKDMENELGKQLLIRGNRKITLTDEGMILRKRAQEILDLVNKTENEITFSDEDVAGNIYIGAGETHGIHIITKTAKLLCNKYPHIHYHITSGDAVDIEERLTKGLFDFAVLMGDANDTKYDYIKLPAKSTWGVLMRKDSPLAKLDFITPEDLYDKPLIFSRQAVNNSPFNQWFKKRTSQLNISATYNLIYNASIMVEDGLGYALCIDKIINTGDNSELCFKTLNPTLELGMCLVWKKYQIFSKASEKFLEKLQETL